VTSIQQNPGTVGRSASSAKAWLRALELTAPIGKSRGRVFFSVIDELAAQCGDSPALLSSREALTFRELAERSNRYARWAADQGISKGDTVCLLMPNRPEYMAAWIGINRIGAVVALLNTNLTGPSLAHSIDVVQPKHIISDSDLFSALDSAVPHIRAGCKIWLHGASTGAYSRVDLRLEEYAAEPITDSQRQSVTIEDDALYIYTSGTTGPPKAAKVSHARIMQWSYWFAGMMDIQPTDRVYDCLPMYHSVGGVLATGAMLVAGGSVVIREKFSVSQFWDDVVRWDCTLIQYIGELCRYLLNSRSSSNEKGHRVRMACGNGLRPDIWIEFKNRFQLPQIFEFYAATEGGVSLFNVEGECGAIGRIPSYLQHRFSPTLVRFDVEKEEPARNEDGFCIRCGPNEIGEAIGPVLNDFSNVGSRFEGYTDSRATERRILRDVFKPGDRWIRTGDLMRKDEKGFFYFVDRTGDTFRWKGENVATSDVLEAISAFPGIKDANVYGVTIPSTDGRVGMAAVVTEGELDLQEFRKHLTGRLPHYARPLFLRIRQEIELTGTFKHMKSDLVRQGYDPAATVDPLYFNHPEYGAFVLLDSALYDSVQAGRIRL
jgi:fatty-acyl-CoA synthase